MSAHSSIDLGSNYERLTGNCTRIVAEEIARTISPPITTSSFVLDNACGPGIVTEQIKLLYPDAKILASDIAPVMIEQVKERIEREAWTDVEAVIMDGRDLSGLKDESVSHAITAFGMLDPVDEEAGVKTAKAMYRVLKVGGVAMFANWADRVWPFAFVNAARAIRPLDPVTSPMLLKVVQVRAWQLVKHLEEGGFSTDVEVRSFLTYTEAKSLDELVENIWLYKDMLFAGYDEAELIKAKAVLKEELKKTRTFEEVEGSVRIGMKAWIATARKTGDELETPW